MNKNLILYLSILIFGLAAPFIFPAFKVQLSILCILIVLATTWNVQGGEMGYNTFGNILFYGLGMYLCASVQVGMFFPLAEWTEGGGEKTFVHTPTQFFHERIVLVCEQKFFLLHPQSILLMEKTFQLELMHINTFQVHKTVYYQMYYNPSHHLEHSKL